MASRSGCRSSRSLIRASVRCGEKARALRRDAQRGGGAVRLGGEFGQAGRFDAAPEYPRRVRIGEEAEVVDAHGDGRARRQRRQRGLQFRQPLPPAIRR